MVEQEPEENQDSQSEPEVVDLEDVESLQKALAEEKEKGEGYLANWQRAQADFINYKRRSEQQMEEVGKFANSTIMLNLLPVLDDLERAITSIPPKLVELSWVDGIRLIERKLRATLEAHGLSSIEALGKPFDPNLHEAAMHGNGKEGIVIEELQKGYKLHDRVIRPSMVVVGNGEEKEEKNG
ncbi:nucleotide exchange factor GrpE [Chloroflexota bacterium]